MAATINQKVATTQSPTTAAEFHGQASEKSADVDIALFDGSQTSFEPQDGPVAAVQPAKLPILFRPKHLDLGIRTEPSFATRLISVMNVLRTHSGFRPLRVECLLLRHTLWQATNSFLLMSKRETFLQSKQKP